MANEIFPRERAIEKLVIDNREELVNVVIRETLRSLNVRLVITFPYHPLCNVKLKRFLFIFSRHVSEIIKRK